ARATCPLTSLLQSLCPSRQQNVMQTPSQPQPADVPLPARAQRASRARAAKQQLAPQPKQQGPAPADEAPKETETKAAHGEAKKPADASPLAPAVEMKRDESPPPVALAGEITGVKLDEIAKSALLTSGAETIKAPVDTQHGQASG